AVERRDDGNESWPAARRPRLNLGSRTARSLAAAGAEVGEAAARTIARTGRSAERAVPAGGDVPSTRIARRVGVDLPALRAKCRRDYVAASGSTRNLAANADRRATRYMAYFDHLAHASTARRF